MLRAKLLEPKNFKLVESDMRDINDDEILVRVIYSGICGSDIHSYLGHNLFVNYPVILGHEFVGKIAKVGSASSRFKTGDIVTAEPSIVCDKCEYCQRGDYHLCSNIQFMEGSFSEYVIVKEKNTYLIPEEIELRTSVLIEPLAVAVHAVKISQIEKGQSVLIFGAGTIGQLVMQVTKHYGAEKIAIIDLVESKLKKAKRNGVDLTLKLNMDAHQSDVIDFFQKDSFDIVFDCLANNYSLNTSIEITKRGGKIIIVGQPTQTLSLAMEKVQIKELKIFSSFMYKNNFLESIELIKKNKVNLSGFISKIFKFKDIEFAFNKILMNGYKYIKCLLVM